MNVLETVLKIVSYLPAEALKGFTAALNAILRGDGAAAAKHARVTAETVAAKQMIRAPYKARRK
jgi:hypothetical protein